MCHFSSFHSLKMGDPHIGRMYLIKTRKTICRGKYVGFDPAYDQLCMIEGRSFFNTPVLFTFFVLKKETWIQL